MLDTILSWTSLPNLHPLAVHFPIALLPAALLLDGVALAWGRQEWLGRAAGMVYGLAGASALVALELGERAADSLRDVPPGVQPHIALHSDWGHWAAWALGGIALVRIALLFSKKLERSVVLRGLVLLLGLGALGAVTRAADLGGGLVYGHGLGVEQATSKSGEGESHDHAGSDSETIRGEPDGGFQEQRDGGFRWRPKAGDQSALGSLLRPVEGSDLSAVEVDEAEEEEGLALRVQGRALLVFPGQFGDLQLDAELDLAQFEGSVGLAHHVVSAATHRLFRVERSGGGDPAAESRVALLTIEDREAETLDESTTPVPGRGAQLGVSVAGRHLKAFVDGATVVHGHEPPAEPAAVGLLLDGSGTVVIRAIALTVL